MLIVMYSYIMSKQSVHVWPTKGTHMHVLWVISPNSGLAQALSSSSLKIGKIWRNISSSSSSNRNSNNNVNNSRGRTVAEITIVGAIEVAITIDVTMVVPVVVAIVVIVTVVVVLVIFETVETAEAATMVEVVCAAELQATMEVAIIEVADINALAVARAMISAVATVILTL